MINNGTELNVIPKGWTWSRIGDLFKIVGGGTPATNNLDYWEGDVPWISSADIDSLKVRPRRFITEEAIKNSATNKVPPGSLIVITRVGLGKVAKTDTEICFSQDCQALIPLSNFIINIDYALYYLYKSAQIFKYNSRGTTVSGITKKQLAELPFPLPPLNEQHRIVAKIEELFSMLDAGVEALREAQGLLKLYRVAILETAVMGRLDATGVDKAMLSQENQESGTELLSRILAERRRLWHEQKNRRSYRYREPISPVITNLPELPPKWTWATLDQLLLTLRNGISEPPHGDGGLPVLRISAVRPMFLDISDVRFFENPSSSYYDFVLEPGDLLFTRYNGNPSLVGVCAMVKKVTGTIVYPDKIIRGKVVSGSLVLPDYLEIALNVGYSRRFIWDRARTTAGQTGISGADLRQTPVPLPPFIEQQRIVSEIQRHYSVLDHQEKVYDSSLIASKRLRQRILEMAFSGELVPQDPTDEPASKLLQRIRAERARMEAEQPRRRKRRAN